MKLTMIVACGKNWAIGNENQLLWKCPGDLQFFKNYTEGSILIMGRKTWESLPKKPLSNRVNIVITSNPHLVENAITAKDPDEALRIAQHIQTSLGSNVGVIGGGQIYAAFMDRATDLVISLVDDSPEADVFFPAVSGKWAMTDVLGNHTTDCGKAVTVIHWVRQPE